jgi:AcrR family transcriptional regulator
MVGAGARRTQEQRSQRTRARLLDATIECLIELGYSGTSTPEIARRAGVSRGAQLHHFPTKAELVTGAVEHLFDLRNEEFQRAFVVPPPEADRKRVALHLLWSFMSGPTFYAWLELSVAARTDPALRQPMSALTRRFSDIIDANFRAVFPPPAPPDPLYDVVPGLTVALLVGLAIEHMIVGDAARTGHLLDVWHSFSVALKGDAPDGA